MCPTAMTFMLHVLILNYFLSSEVYGSCRGHSSGKLSCWLSIAGIKLVPVNQMPEMEEKNRGFNVK